MKTGAKMIAEKTPTTRILHDNYIAVWTDIAGENCDRLTLGTTHGHRNIFVLSHFEGLEVSILSISSS